jgi:hypothetical protein
MAERELYNNLNSPAFPFAFVRQNHTRRLAAILCKFEEQLELKPLSNFVTAINTILVWAGARPASLPDWNYCNEEGIAKFIKYLNQISTEIPKNLGPPVDVIILQRPQVYRSGDVIGQRLITHPFVLIV